MNPRSLLIVVLGLNFSACLAHAADWAQWRGPHRNGISAETGLLKEWPSDGPKLAWQVKDLGGGYSTPAVVGDRLYLMSNQGKEDEYVQALSTADGKQLWSARVGNVGKNTGPQYPGARSTPVVDGDAIYALGSDGDLVCLDLEGKARWQKSLRTDFGGKPGAWAYSESPLVDGNAVVCTPGGSEATIVALNKKTGETIWKSAVPEGDEAAYASIIIVNAAAVKQYVQFLQKGLVGIDASSGKFLWRYDRTAKGSPANIPTPLAQGDFVYSAAGKSGGAVVQLKANAGGVEASEVYFQPKLPTSIGGSVDVGGFLYGTNSAGLMCAEFATGEVKWQDKCVGAASVCEADGRLYVHGEKGDVALVEVTPDAYREKGRFTLPDQPDRAKSRSQAWAYPVIANGRLYIRDLDMLWCYDVQAGK